MIPRRATSCRRWRGRPGGFDGEWLLFLEGRSVKRLVGSRFHVRFQTQHKPAARVGQFLAKIEVVFVQTLNQLIRDILRGRRKKGSRRKRKRRKDKKYSAIEIRYRKTLGVQCNLNVFICVPLWPSLVHGYWVWLLQYPRCESNTT